MKPQPMVIRSFMYAPCPSGPILEWTIEISKGRCDGTFAGQYCTIRINAPVDPKIRIIKANSAVGGRILEGINLIKHVRCRLERHKAMQEALWDQQLCPIFSRQLFCHPVPIGRRAPPHIDGDIPYTAPCNAYQLGLCTRRRLIMQSTHGVRSPHAKAV